MWESLPDTPEFRAFMQTSAFLALPAMSPPKGVTPNYENPSSLRAPGFAATQLTLVVLAVGLRVYVKTCIIKKTMLEDCLLYLSSLLFVLFHILVFKTEELPLGVHQYNLKVAQALKHAKLFFVGAGAYPVVLLTAKLTLLLQVRRMFIPLGCVTGLGQQHRYLRWCIDVTITVNIIAYLPMLISHWCVCRPIRSAWDPRVEGVCLTDGTVSYVFSGVLNVVTDLVIVSIPQPLVWSLKIETRRKWSLSLVFGLGCLAFAASIARLAFTVQWRYSEDKTYFAALMGRGAELELTSSLLTACFPVLPPFVRRLRRGARYRSGSSIWGSRMWANEPVESSPELRSTYAVTALRPIGDASIDLREDRLGTPGPLQQTQVREQTRLATDLWFENRVNRDSNEIIVCRDI